MTAAEARQAAFNYKNQIAISVDVLHDCEKVIARTANRGDVSCVFYEHYTNIKRIIPELEKRGFSITHVNNEDQVYISWN